MKLQTRVRSLAMRSLGSPRLLNVRRRHARIRRRIRRRAPEVLYFHQADDPYSHLAVQKLALLQQAYDIRFSPILVSGPASAFQGDTARFTNWANSDASAIAADYNTTLDIQTTPQSDQVAAANNLLLACLESTDFAAQATAIGEQLWLGQPLNVTGQQSSEAITTPGNRQRKKLGHYLGGMFYFDGEWFWGIDRIRLLETRLIAEGFGAGPLQVPEPELTMPRLTSDSTILLEYFPSLRSPYTAIGHADVLRLIAGSGVKVKLRPVMPMMMRGVPAPFAKQRYIMTDAAREGRFRGRPFGRIVDPFGDPVKRAFALLPHAAEKGRELAFVTAYLQAAWFDGIDISRPRGLHQVCANAGLDWLKLPHHQEGGEWQRQLDDNLEEMQSAGLWGVPSFRVSGGNREGAFSCWGQDRLWRVAREITERV